MASTEGTHGGMLSVEARRRRVAKNARNRARRGSATRPRGAAKYVRSRLYSGKSERRR